MHAMLLLMKKLLIIQRRRRNMKTKRRMQLITKNAMKKQLQSFLPSLARNITRRSENPSGIFDRRRRDSLAMEIEPGIEDIDDENVEEEGTTANARKKKCKFTSEQYVSLAKSWTHISQGSISGNNMKGRKFWERVVEFYNTLEPMKRTWGSLRGGYRVMNAACQNYLAILTRLQNRHQSGDAAPYDIIEESRKAYQLQYGQPFKFQECFELLSSLPKWKNQNNFMFEQQYKARRMNYSGSSPGSDPSS